MTKEDIEAGNSPFDADETLGISDIHIYSHRLFDAFDKLEFRTCFNNAIQAFYLEEGLYVVRSHSMGKYQYTLVEASSEEMAIRSRNAKIKELESQIEKLIDFVLSKTECCDVCPITDTCINSEGTCPYAGILAKGEKEVTREWLMQFISRR